MLAFFSPELPKPLDIRLKKLHSHLHHLLPSYTSIMFRISRGFFYNGRRHIAELNNLDQELTSPPSCNVQTKI